MVMELRLVKDEEHGARIVQSAWVFSAHPRAQPSRIPAADYLPFIRSSWLSSSPMVPIGVVAGSCPIVGAVNGERNESRKLVQY